MSESVSETLRLTEEVLNAQNEAGPFERVKDDSMDSVRHLKLEREADNGEGERAAARDNVEASSGAMNKNRDQMAEMHQGKLASMR